MPDVTPSGILSEPIGNIATVLASLDAFQEWCGVDEEIDPDAAALLHVYPVEVASPTRPCAIVSMDTEFAVVAIAGGATARETIVVQLIFEDDVADANKASAFNAYYAFSNAISAIMAEFWTTVRASGTPDVNAYKLKNPPARSDDKERRGPEGDYYQVVFQIFIGVKAP